MTTTETAVAVLQHQVSELVGLVRDLEQRMRATERWRWGIAGAIATASGVLSSFLTQIGT